VDASLTGQRLGRYLVGRRIGAGGFGAVYEGTQEDLRRPVAIKVLRADLAESPVLVERFRREALAAAGLGHAHIVQVTDFTAASGDDPPFLVMELLAGKSLHRSVEDTWPKKMPADRIARIGVQLLSALEAAHAAGIVHRDVKPDNVFLCDTSADADLVKVLDFGVAKLKEDKKAEDPEPLTKDGAVLGTPAYMASEQALGLDVDGRADVYGAGGCLFFAATGRHPVLIGGRRDFGAIALGKAPALASLRPDLDPAFCAIVDRALQNDREARFASAAEMRSALRRWLGIEPDIPSTELAAPPVAVAPTLSATSYTGQEEKPTKPAPAPDTLVARQAPTPPSTLSSTLVSPEERAEPPPRRSRAWIVAALAAAILAVAVGPRLLRPPVAPVAPISTQAASAAPSSAPSVQVADPPPAPPPAVVASVPSAAPVAPSVAVAPPARPSASASATRRAFPPFNEQSVGQALANIAPSASRDCSSLEGPRVQTFLVHFVRASGDVGYITTTSTDPPSPARACIEKHLRGLMILPWNGEPAEGVSAVTVRLQELPGTIKGFD
jgi:serine/threonine-protein kinase